MSELAQIVALWHASRSRGEDYVLATVVRVEGSSYRKPGARMLVSAGGMRAGTISGGCLEAEVVRKAFWLTEKGPALKRYQSSFDDDGVPRFGLGCGGTIYLLLERGRSADAVLEAVEESWTACTSFAILTVLDEKSEPLSSRAIFPEGRRATGSLSSRPGLMALADATLKDGQSSWHTIALPSGATEIFAEYLPRATSLLIFGAGDDAQPVAQVAAGLGWRITVADGRANLLRQERFPADCKLLANDPADPLGKVDIGRTDAAVLMTHSYEQDGAALAALLQTTIPYIGVLGPSHRTAELVAKAASTTGLDRDACMQRLHSPVGLDIGADTPASIALAIVAEILAFLRSRSGLSRSSGRVSPTRLDEPRRETPVGISA